MCRGARCSDAQRMITIGLETCVSPTGGRRRAFRYHRNGIAKQMGFGSAKETGLKLSDARDKAIDALRLLTKGTDPKEHCEEEKRRANGQAYSIEAATALTG
jgi:Arm DNA-binding domain